MAKVNPLAAALLSVVVLAGLVGCSGSGPALDKTRWRLTEWTLSSLDPTDFKIIAEFADGRIAGTSGVNSYTATFHTGPGAAFSVGPVAGTRMAGPEPAMRAEGAYLTLLGQARSFKLSNGQLTLFDEGGNESLIFAAASR